MNSARSVRACGPSPRAYYDGPIRRTALLASLLVCLCVAPAARAAHRQVPRGWLGVMTDGPLTTPGFTGAAAEWNRIVASGAESARVAFWWQDLQPSSAATTNLAATDPTVLAAAARGIQVLPVVEGTPVWARQNAGDPASPPRDPAD